MVSSFYPTINLIECCVSSKTLLKSGGDIFKKLCKVKHITENNILLNTEKIKFTIRFINKYIPF